METKTSVYRSLSGIEDKDKCIEVPGSEDKDKCGGEDKEKNVEVPLVVKTKKRLSKSLW